MSELIHAFGAGLLWLAAFAAVTVALAPLFAGRPGPALLAAYPIFFAAQMLLIRGLHAVNTLTTTGIITAFGAATLVVAGYAALRARRHGTPFAAEPENDDTGAADPDTRLIRMVVFAAIAFVFAALLVFTLVTPVYIWDSLAYHMPMVASYVQNASLESWPTQDLRQIFRVNGGELQMLSVALLAHSDVWVELPNVLGLAICLVATREIGRVAALPQALCYVALALVLTAPQIVVGAGTAKNDLTFTAALLAAFYWFLRAAAGGPRGTRPTGPRTPAAIALAGLSAALAASTKVMGLNVIGTLGLLGIALVLKRRMTFRHLVLFGASAAGAALLLVGHVYLGNLTATAVPVGIAPGEVRFTIGPANLVEAVRYYVYELGFKRLAAPQAFEHDFLHYGYVYPLLLVGAVATALRQLRAPRFITAALSVITVILLGSVVAMRTPISWDQRFMIWLMPALALLALLGPVRPRPRVGLIMATAASTLAVMNTILLLTNEAESVFNRAALHLAATGTPARYGDVVPDRYHFMLDGFDSLDAAATARDSVLYAGTDDSWMYMAWGRRFTRHVEGVWNAEHAAHRLASRGFRFVVLEHGARPDIHAAIVGHAAGAGYSPLTSGGERTVYVRDAAPAAALPVEN